MGLFHYDRAGCAKMIAVFSPFLFVMVALLAYLYIAGGDYIENRPRFSYIVPVGYLIYSACIVFLLSRICIFSRGYIFPESKSVYIKKDVLVFFHPFYFSKNLKEIEDVFVAYPRHTDKFRVIHVKMKSGRTRELLFEPIFAESIENFELVLRRHIGSVRP